MSNLTEDYFSPPQEEIINNDLVFFLQLVAGGLVSVLLVLALILNLANIATVAGHVGLRGSGYFHLVALFSVFNVIFYVFKLKMLLIEVIKEIDFGQFITDVLSQNPWIEVLLNDLVMALVGLQLLLLSLLTLEHRLNLSRHFYFKPKGQTCMRIFMTLMAFLLVIVCLTLATLIRTTDLLWSSKS